jgi:protein involved in polysaccharide export with SLBB domain
MTPFTVPSPHLIRSSFRRFARFRRLAAPRQLALLAALGVVSLFSPRAQAQLEEMGIQNTNNAAVMQQQKVAESQSQSGQCTDPDPANCGGAAGAGGLGGGSTASDGNFQFQQPQQYNSGAMNERAQPQYSFRPQAPTEFQRYVADATGIFLPLFGAELFQGVPSTFAPLTNVPVTADYVIGPGDEILMQAYGQISFDLHLTVDRSGEIDIPKVGTVRVAGLKYSQLQPFLEKQVGRNFRNFTLFVNLGQLRTLQIFVTGQARRPGSFTLSSLSTLVNAVFAVGGPAANGSMRNIELRRDGELLTTFDMYDLILRGDKSKDVRLLPGDVIFFPVAGPRVAVFGSVGRPAIYELKGAATIDSVLALSGGLTTIASQQNAEIQRIEPGGANGHKLRHVLEVQLNSEGRNARLEDGDILRVLSLVPKFDNAIVLRGNVANPGTYAWHEGMKVRELIPDRDSLLTRDYWKQRARLGLPILDYQPDATVNPTADNAISLQQRVVSGNTVQQQQRDRAAVLRGFNPDYQSNGGNGGSGNSSGANGIQVQPNDSNESTLGSSTASTQVNIIGNASSAGSAPPLAQRFPPKNTVELQVADINWSYAVIERTNKDTLKTELLPFHLGALVMDGDETQDLALQPGDVVTIFSQADMRIPQAEQTRLVHIEGEVAHGGIYSVMPGETLRQVLARAGGFTPNAYLYGASFTRETVRQQQQQRLDEYVNRLAQDLQHTAEQAASQFGDTSASQVQERNIGQLRSLRASGRVVLSIRPEDHDLSAIPDIALEDGDHFLVPPIPSSVNVVGSVYNQSSFVYGPDRREGDYLREAGGPDRLADARHEFIVRADGSVVSRTFSSGKLLASFNAERINPGDTIVIPQKLIRPSSLRTLLEYANVFSTLGLTAATISLVR